MTDEQTSNWEYKIICCLGISTSNSDINVVALHKTVKELYEQGRLDEREAQVCCGDYEKCMKACTPRGRWLAEKELAKPKQSKYSDIVSDGGFDPRNKFDGQTEPVSLRDEAISTNDHLCAMLRQVHDVLACTALPMKRPWVGLTDEQLSETYNALYTQYTRDDVNIADFILIARTIESQLKEKNSAL